MPASYVFLGDKPLTPAQESVLETKVQKKSVEVAYQLGQTTIEGKFVEPAKVGAALWDAVSAAIAFPGDRKAKKIISRVDKPGTYPLEVEANGAVYRGKLVYTPDDGDKSQPVMRPGTRPAKVKLELAGASKRRMPREFERDLDNLITLMKRPRSYVYAGGTGSRAWTCELGRYKAVPQPSSDGWKVRIDASRNTPMMWRLYFGLAFDAATKTLNVRLTRIQEEH